ncbi:sugar phosphate nucleotidyltransferase, partial [Escherichia coli]|nr:sugar phosphate nucleotidyltransferase [Escherichia coli]
IMKINPEGRITDFEEKPKTPEALARARSSPDSLSRLGMSHAEDRPFLASMGIYLFNRSTLVELLASSNATDFGKELFPLAIPNHRVQA